MSAVDDFNRANGPLGTATSGQTWTTYRGTFAVVSNQAAPTDSLVSNGALAVIDTGISDIDMTIELNWLAATSRRVIFRAVDGDNYWALQYNMVHAVIGGSSVGGADPRQAVLSSNLVSGDIARIRAIGSTIQIYKNATLVAAVDSTGTFDTATEVGLAAFNDNAARWDNLSVELAEECPEDAWTVHTARPVPPTYFGVFGGASDIAASAVIGDDLYVMPWGDAVGRLWRYQPATDTWTQLASMPGSYGQVFKSVVTVWNGKIFRFGGASSTGGLPVTAHSYDPDTDTWTAVTGIPDGRMWHNALTIGDETFILGGDTDAIAATTRVDVFDHLTGTWTTGGAAALPVHRKDMGGAVWDEMLYVAGGFNNPTTGAYDRLDRYDRSTDTWSAMATMPGTRAEMPMAAGNGRLYVTGGATGGGLLSSVGVVDTYVYEIDLDTWSSGVPLTSGRMNHSSAVLDGSLWVIGGALNSSTSRDGLTECLGLEAPLCSPPVNDNVADAPNFVGTSGTFTGTICGATTEPGEGVDWFWAGHSVWYRYAPVSDGLLSLEIAASFAPRVGVYGNGIDQPTEVQGPGPTVDLNVFYGTVYYIRVDAEEGVPDDPGDFVLSWTGPASILECPDNSVWYAYTPSTSGVASFFIDAEGLSVVMEVFTGTDLDSLVGPVASYEGDDPLSPTTVAVVRGVTYWIRVYNAVPCESGSFTLSWDLVPTLMPRTARQGTGRLGCGELAAFITSQCGAPRLCQLTDASNIAWNRRLDDISDASVVVPTGGSNESECCECLAEIEPWCHELHIFRNGVFVWGGPVAKVTYGYDEVIIDAKDVLAWTQFRVPELTLDYSVVGADIADIAETILLLAFAEHDPCVVEFIQKRPTEFPNINLNPLVCFEQSAYEQLTDIADGLLDFTVLGRSIILGGENLPTKAIGVLTDEMILGEIEVTKNGMLAGNRYFTRFEGDDVAVQCAPEVDITCPGCTCKCPAISEGDQECYGPLEHLLDVGQPANHATAQQFGDAHLAATRIVPRTIEFNDGTRISPEAPWDINDMVPGQRIDVTLTGLCLPVFQSFRLVEMTSSQAGLGEEEVTVSLELVVPAADE